MAALTIVVVLAVVVGSMMWVVADRMERGELQPNMGHHTQHSTTPESWAEARSAVAEALRWCAKHYFFAAVLSLGVAAWRGSGEAGAGAGAMIFILSATIVVISAVRAIGLLVPNGEITR